MRTEITIITLCCALAGCASHPGDLIQSEISRFYGPNTPIKNALFIRCADPSKGVFLACEKPNAEWDPSGTTLVKLVGYPLSEHPTNALPAVGINIPKNWHLDAYHAEDKWVEFTFKGGQRPEPLATFINQYIERVLKTKVSEMLLD